ncbi:MAG: hypothetical protein AB1589_01640 [Cyanobacteriota bacterium]
MSGSPLKKFVLTPAIISTSVFAILALPLALVGNKPVAIKLQQEPVFYGQLRDVTTPYLGLAGIFSLGTGVASVAVAGWQQSRRKSEKVEAQLSGLTQHLKEKEAQLEALKLSESQLEVSGLKAFLDDKAPLELTTPTAVLSVNVPSAVEELAITPPVLEPQIRIPQMTTVQEKAAKFACAQTFLGYAQVKESKKTAPNVSELRQKEVEQLQAQLQQMMAQMASLQSALISTQQSALSEVFVPTNVTQLQGAKPWSVYEKAL